MNVTPRKHLVVGLVLVTSGALAESHLKSLKIAITNPGAHDLPAANIVLPVADLKKIAPDFYAGSQIVTVTDATTLEEDAATIEAVEVPSEIDSYNDRSEADELAFQIPLRAHQTRIVSITYGSPDRIFRLRGDYPARTNAIFAKKSEGIGWESERVAFRLYFDQRNAIDLYGKTRPMLLLDRFATPGYIYHNASPDGRDIYRVGQGLGAGGVAGWVNNEAVRVSDVSDRKWHIISTGPVRTIIEVTYDGWKVGSRTINLKSRIVQWAGERGFTQTISSPNAGDFTFATGLTKQDDLPDLRSIPNERTPWLALWGEQVLEPANQGVSPYLKGTNLGLAVIMAPETRSTANWDDKNYLLTFPLTNQTASWYTMAAWDKEASNDPLPVNGGADRRGFANLVSSGEAIASKQQFLAAVRDQVSRMENPPMVRMLSTAPQPQSAPPDTLKPATSRTYSQAMDLLRSEIDRTATKWAPIISASDPSTFGAYNGAGFFTEADEQTGEWKPQKGFFWTGSFWTGQLWKMFELTHDEKYKNWAELWTARLVGHEAEQNHDTGFLYFYSAVPGYRLTHDPKLRESAIRGAGHLEQWFNPKVHLIPAWSADGDDTIVDCMMNLQLLFWANNETGNPKWRDIALQHAQRTAEWFVRDDGSTVQSVHYNPGDNRQHFQLHGGGDRDLSLPNHVGPGERVFSHTHQGYAWNTTWSRGEAWALYGFAVTYGETHDPRFLATAEKLAEYVIAELPRDGVPWYDFNDEGIIFRNRDTSAAAIAAGGLLKLSHLEQDSEKAARYRQQAEQMVHSLIDRYLTPTFAGDTTPPGILRHGSSTRPDDAGLIYGQYFLLEDLMELTSGK